MLVFVSICCVLVLVLVLVCVGFSSRALKRWSQIREENHHLHDTEGPESCLHLPSDDGSPAQPFLKQMFFFLLAVKNGCIQRIKPIVPLIYSPLSLCLCHVEEDATAVSHPITLMIR